MPPGPLPDPTSVRRNTAAIPSTELPAGGRVGDVPDVPVWVELGEMGSRWWAWAWATPEAAGWTSSAVDIVGQRASLVDDLAAIRQVGSLDAFDVLDCESGREIKELIGRLAAFALGRNQILKTMALLDQQLGFGAKNRLALRWTVDGEAEPAAAPDTELTEKEQLLVEASSLGVEVSKRWGVKRIRAAVEASEGSPAKFGSRARLKMVAGGSEG